MDEAVTQAIRILAKVAPMASHQATSEVTRLSPADEQRFQQWALENRIPDVDSPDSYYDYRGYWKEFGGKPIQFGADHFTDTYKQHGHPLFSSESKYSRGPSDGGRWLGEALIPAPMTSHEQVKR